MKELNKKNKESEEFAEAAGEFLARESDDSTRLLEFLENDPDKRRAFFQAIDANIALEEHSPRTPASIPASAAKSNRFKLMAMAAGILLVLGGAVWFLRVRTAWPGADVIWLTGSLNKCEIQPKISMGPGGKIDGPVVTGTGELSICDLALGGERPVRLRVRPRSRLRIERFAAGWKIELMDGKILLLVPPGRKQEPILVNSGGYKVVITGTRVSIERKKTGLRVKLLRGSVRIEGLEGRETAKTRRIMKAGEKLDLRAGQVLSEILSSRETRRLSVSFESMSRVAAAKDSPAVRRFLLRDLKRSRGNVWRGRLRLHDGGIVTGFVTRKGDTYVILTQDGRNIAIKQKSVKELEILRGEK